MLEKLGRKLAREFMSHARIHNYPRDELDARAVEYFITAAATEKDSNLANVMTVLCELVTLNGYEYVERAAKTDVHPPARKNTAVQVSKEAQRAMLEAMCASFPKEKIQYLPQGASSMISGYGWRKILETPGKTDLEKVRLERELAQLLAEADELERELKRAEKGTKK